jgi:integrase
MSRKSVPAYRLHKPSGQARTIINGRHYYLGKYNSPESRQKYARLLATKLDEPQNSSVTSLPPLEFILVAELLVKYLTFAQTHYVSGGEPTKEYRCMVTAAKHINDLYSDLPASEFGPAKLKTVRQSLIDSGLCRTEINKRCKRFIRIFKWAASEELVSAAVYESLRTVAPLRYGKTSVRESEPVKPVDDEYVDLVLPYLTPVVAAMVQLQRISGMRPAEVITMKPKNLVRSSDVWIYEPEAHKNQWRGQRRQIQLGPKCQAILSPFLNRSEDEFIFSPKESENWRREQIHQDSIAKSEQRQREPSAAAKKKTRIYQPLRRKTLRQNFSVDSYRRSIDYAIQRLNEDRVGRQPPLPPIPKWFPYQLRHTFATCVRQDFGVEIAQLGLGHARTNIIDVYAEKSFLKYQEFAREHC